jgi:RNA 2',3'-cyclic 3'-phosphodiesterase
LRPLAPGRIFTAVSLPRPSGERLVSGIPRAVRDDGRVQWVPPDQYHVTLHFIGEFEEARMVELRERLGGIGRLHRPFRMSWGGFGVFPGWEDPRVLFVPLLSGGVDLRDLFRDISSAASGLGGVGARKDYHPHITLGRAKAGRRVGDAADALREALPGFMGETGVEKFILYRSRPDPSGSFHENLGEFLLGGV